MKFILGRSGHNIGLCLLLAITMALSTGCGNSDLADVRGVVTLDGEPVPDAFVTFTPVTTGATSFAKTAADGSYRMRFTDSETGAFIGSNHVAIRTGDVKADNSGSIKEIVPNVYNDKTTLLAEVKSGKNTFDWKLKSDEGKVIQPEMD